MPAAAVEALADHLASTMPGLEAVNGLEPQPATFAQRWQQRTGRGVSRRSPQRLYQLGELRAPVGVRGTSRPARLDELEQLSAWMEAFGVETHAVGVAARAELARLVEHGQLFVWEQAEAATSLAALRGPVAGVVRVSAVYTPPAHRRRGYASALIAAISRHALDEGAQACVLYTAANNPTSNAIYQAIGYRLVSEAGVYTFEAPAGLPAGEHGLGRALVPGQLAR
jgi:predicted GNAT family acetyltransferase